MAVEVIERGTPPEEVNYEVQCQKCISKLKFKRSDAGYVSDQRDGNYLTVECPVCRNLVTKSLGGQFA